MSLPNPTNADVKAAAALLVDMLENGGLGLLTTADAGGAPHATWMATVAATGTGGIVTLTSPDSRKVRNIEENPRTEWLFTRADKERLLYLSGESEIVESRSEIKRYWGLMREKDQAYFLNHFNSGMGFAIVLTQVNLVTMVFPKENRKVVISPGDLWKTQFGGS